MPGRTCCSLGRRRRVVERVVRRAGEVEEVGAFGFVELQGAGDGFEDAVGDTGEVAALEPGVVVDAHPGQDGDLFAAQARAPAGWRRGSAARRRAG